MTYQTKNINSQFLFGKIRRLKAFMQNFYTEFNKNLSLMKKTVTFNEICVIIFYIDKTK